MSITNIYQRNKEVGNIWLFGMLRLAKVLLEPIICIISAFRLTDTQKSSCFLLIYMALDHILLHHLDHFVLHYHSFSSSIFFGLILSSVILEVALNQMGSLKIIFRLYYFIIHISSKVHNYTSTKSIYNATLP